MKKLKSTKLLLNKVYISKIQNAHLIIGGTAQGDPVGAEENRQEPDSNHCAAATSWCTQATQTTGEVTAHEQNQTTMSGTTTN